MKNQLTYLASLAFVLSLAGCKKDRAVPENTGSSTPRVDLSLATASIASIGVETLYGSPYAPGALINGTGTAARFNGPSGLQLMANGTLYVADTKNNAVRKITVSGEVSTVTINPSPDGAMFQKPVYIGVEQTTGDFHFVLDGFDGDGYDASWIAKSNGDFVQLYLTTYVNATALGREPYTDIFYYSSGGSITQHIYQPEGIYGASIPYDKNKLGDPEAPDRRGFSWDAIAFGYNKVIYFSKNGAIYKYTPGGVTAAVSNGYGLQRLTAMILNKDSRTMYVADNGYIKRIDHGKVTILAGPKGTNDGRDGLAKDADVYAFGLALAKGENSLYFTDLKANTVRRIYLK